MKYFVTADIHGFYDGFIKALNEKRFDLNNPEHHLIICGDVFDRGHQPKELIDYILKNKDKITYIRGNHEDLMQAMIERNHNNVSDIHNGTTGTIIDLCPEWQVSEFDLKKIAKDTRLQEVLDLSINYFETNKYIFVHGWIPVLNGCYEYDKNWRKATTEQWNKARWTNPVEMYKHKVYEPNKIIVCGHWHCSALWYEKYPDVYEEFGDKAKFEPFITKEMIALDACTVYSHKVNVIVIEDQKVLY